MDLSSAKLNFDKTEELNIPSSAEAKTIKSTETNIESYNRNSCQIFF